MAIVRSLAVVATCLPLFVGASVTVFGEPRLGPNIDPSAKLDAEDSPLLSAVGRMALSDRLAAYGDNAADPVALALAAKIRKGVEAQLPNVRDVRGDSFTELLDRAQRLAPSDPTISALIADVRSYRSRDLPMLSAGVKALRSMILGNGQDRIELTFRGAEPAVVYVHVNADIDLDLYVYDEYNNLVCADESVGSEAVCRWRPRWTGSFLVEVRNKNDSRVEYVLTANPVALPG
jgi:hypothetical protein